MVPHGTGRRSPSGVSGPSSMMLGWGRQRFAFVQLHEAASVKVASGFLQALIEPCPTRSTQC